MTNSYTYEHQFAYDVFGRTTSTKVGNGTSFRTLSSMTYNNAGLLARQTYGNGDYIDFTYDSLDRITRKQYNGSSTNRMEYLYGSDGSVAQTIDYAANTHTKFVYDLAGRLVSQREYSGVTQLPSYPNAYTNFTYADKTNYLTGIKHVSPLGTQNIGYRYGDLSKQEMPDQIYGVSWNGEEKLSYTYDGLGRLTNKALKVKDDPENGTLNMGYVYEEVGEGERTTTLLKRLLFAGNPLLDYTYDAVGNITSICDGSLAQSFEYDDLNQLVRFNDRYQNKTFTYEYENGNITFEHEYAYTTGELPATPKRSTQYHYDDPAWSDVLTGYSTLRYTSDGKAVASINSVEEIKDRAQSDAYARRFLGDRFKKVDLSKNSLLRQNAKTASVATNGNVIVDDTVSLTVDEIGNLTKVGTNAQLKWNGRQLQDIVMEDGKISYAYNADGQRISKTLAQFGEESVTTEYFYNGEILAGQKTGNDVLVFMYDNNGDIFGFTYNGKPYYYIKNAQNDVMFIVDPEEGAVVLYTYDAWGNITACYDASENNIGTINPITYRSYYYDFELGMYYLNSRYYMPALHRFLNADGYVQTGQDILDKNMFAYCGNNPVNRSDPSGMFWKEIGNFFKGIGKGIVNFVKATFGAGISTSATIEAGANVYIPDPFPITAKTGKRSTQTVSKHGNSSKPISVYAKHDVTHPIKSSSAGIKINISSGTLDISLGLDNLGISGSLTKGNKTNSIGLKANLSELKVGLEFSSAVKWDNTTETTYTNISVSGWAIAAILVCGCTGQPMPSPSYAYGY